MLGLDPSNFYPLKPHLNQYTKSSYIMKLIGRASHILRFTHAQRHPSTAVEMFQSGGSYH